MSLTTRLSAFLLATLALVLVGFSLALYLSAESYLRQQRVDRLLNSLAILVAAAERSESGVEWEPQERELALGQDLHEDPLRWMVHNQAGQLLDHSRNWDNANLTSEWGSRISETNIPTRLADSSGQIWLSLQRTLNPVPSLSKSDPNGKRPLQTGHVPEPDSRFYPSLSLSVFTPLAPVEQTLASLRWLLVALTCGLWLIAAILARWLSRKALTPLTRMVKSAQAIDASDSGWFLEEPQTGDELEDLGHAFNGLLDRLRMAYEHQRCFSTEASHQLRTPVTALIGQIEVALRLDRSSEEYRRVLRLLHGRAGQLGRIVEALMFLGRSDGESALPNLETRDLSTCVREYLAGRSITPQAGNFDLRLTTEPLWVRVHAPLFEQLMENLLDNAIKYSPAGSTILIETCHDHKFATLAIEDDGPGIGAQDQSRIFEPFFRSSDARRFGKSGVGLGLAVVQRIALAFSGTIQVRSELGSGCRFEFRLPIAPPQVSIDDRDHSHDDASVAVRN
jgi:two-component system OmpR family sensor kinase